MKLVGYRASHRNRWLLIKKGILTHQEFLLLELYLDIMDFDKKHDKFGTFEVFFDEIGDVFNKSEDSIRAWHKGLVAKGFVQIFDKKRRLFQIKTPLRYITGEAWGGKANQYVKEESSDKSLEYLLKNTCFSPKKVENIQKKKAPPALKNTPKALGFSKVDSRVNHKMVVIEQRVRSDKEYQKIYQDGNFSVLTPDDMKWVDQNVKEEIIIKNNQMEKDIVRVFFDDDWNEYKKHLIEFPK